MKYITQNKTVLINTDNYMARAVDLSFSQTIHDGKKGQTHKGQPKKKGGWANPQGATLKKNKKKTNTLGRRMIDLLTPVT